MKQRAVFFKVELPDALLARLYPKLRTWFSLSGKNPGFLANTFSISQIIDEDKKVKLLFHIGFSLGDRVAKKWIKSSLEGVYKIILKQLSNDDCGLIGVTPQ